MGESPGHLEVLIIPHPMLHHRRPIKGTLQVPTGRGLSRGASRDTTRGRGIPLRGAEVLRTRDFMHKKHLDNLQGKVGKVETSVQ